MIKIYSEDIDDDLVAIAAAAFEFLELSGEAAVDLEFVDTKEMTRLNSQYRGKNKPTDVLSFPMLGSIKEFNKKNYPLNTIETGEVLLGGIAVCVAVAEKNAADCGHDTRAEICFLFAHGLLHLLGFDHMTDDDENQMRRLENLILAKAGIQFKNN